MILNRLPIIKILSGITLTLFLLPGHIYSETPVAVNTDITNVTTQDNAEAGSYTRKSITFIDQFWSIDGSLGRMKGKYANKLLKSLHKSVKINRFDYNKVSQSVMNRFSNELESRNKRSFEEIGALLEQSLAPEIVAVLDVEKEMRASGLTTEQQRNSFMTDKAKEMGYTIQEINQVMNSAFIYLPVLSNYTIVESKRAYSAKINVGVVWYKVEVNEGAVSVKLFKTMTQSAIGMANKKGLGLRKSRGSYSSEAHESMIGVAVQSLQVAMKQIPAFSLSGQVMEKSFFSVGIDIGEEEGVEIDDKYLLIQQSEDADGEIFDEEIGWAVITDVADTASGKSKNGYISKASIVSGSPLKGDVIREYPRLPLDLFFGWRQYAGKLEWEPSDAPLVEATAGIFIEGHYNIGRGMGLNRLFLSLGVGYAFSQSDTLDRYTEETVEESPLVTLANYDVSLIKKWYVNRFALKVQGGVSVGGIYITTPEDTYSAHGVAAFGAGGIELALFPSLALSGMARYDIGGGTATDYTLNDVAPEYNPTGFAIEAGLVWSLPSISFSFFDVFKMATGI
ncbi:MAG: hypothetical protein OCD01_18140 [Fibrobacterales bacterium]